MSSSVEIRTAFVAGRILALEGKELSRILAGPQLLKAENQYGFDTSDPEQFAGFLHGFAAGALTFAEDKAGIRVAAICYNALNEHYDEPGRVHEGHE